MVAVRVDMSSRLLRKTIAKVKTDRNKPKTPSSLADLCTKSLWEQSIEAGKALELVNTLRKSEEGRRALVYRGLHTQTFIVNVCSISAESSVCGHVPLTWDSEFFFALLDLCDEDDEMHPLGGYDLRFNDVDDAVEWAMEVLKEARPEQCRTYVKAHGDITIPKLRRSDYDNVMDWVVEETDWVSDLNQRFEYLLDPGRFEHDRKPSMLTSEELDELDQQGHPVKHQAVVTLGRDFH